MTTFLIILLLITIGVFIVLFVKKNKLCKELDTKLENTSVEYANKCYELTHLKNQKEEEMKRHRSYSDKKRDELSNNISELQDIIVELKTALESEKNCRYYDREKLIKEKIELQSKIDNLSDDYTHLFKKYDILKETKVLQQNKYLEESDINISCDIVKDTLEKPIVHDKQKNTIPLKNKKRK
jgi:uncharacterized protein YdiU (UPF0061 family)